MSGRQEKLFVTREVAADMLSLSTKTIDRLRTRRELPFHLVGAKVLFLVKDLLSYMDSRRRC
jgi:hypothetical protein